MLIIQQSSHTSGVAQRTQGDPQKTPLSVALPRKAKSGLPHLRAFAEDTPGFGFWKNDASSIKHQAPDIKIWNINIS